MSEKTISLPFKLDTYGRISTASDFSKIWADRVRSVICTMTDERVMEVAFGTKIAEYMFDGVGVAVPSIKTEVEQAFIKFLPTLELENVEVTFDEKSTDASGVIKIEVEYTLPNNKTDLAVVAIAAISRKQPAYQENL
jgi:phage baseplate assembly protein W